MARERVFDDAMVNVLLGALAAVVGVTIVAGPAGLVMGLIYGDEGSLLGAVGFGLLAGLGMCPVTMLFGGAAAHAVRNREMTSQVVFTFAAIGVLATSAFGAMFGMFLEPGATAALAIASVFGGLGAVVAAWLYEASRRRRVWMAWVARLT